MYHTINIQLNFVRVMKIDSFAPVSLRETTPTIPSLRCSQMQIKKCCSGLSRCNKKYRESTLLRVQIPAKAKFALIGVRDSLLSELS